MMADFEIADLAEDIAEHGLREAIVVHEGMILDGRNRQLACELAEVTPRYAEWGDGGSPTAYVLSANLHRRHLNASQKAAVGAEALPMFEAEAKQRQRDAGEHFGRGDDSKLGEKIPQATPRAPKAREIAAKVVGVNDRYVQEAKAIKETAPALFARMKAGEVSIMTAAKELGRTMNGNRARAARPVKNISQQRRHDSFIKATAGLVRIGERWERRMTDTLAPPEARKQLAVLQKARALLDEVSDAVEYRAATLQTFDRRKDAA